MIHDFNCQLMTSLIDDFNCCKFIEVGKTLLGRLFQGKAVQGKKGRGMTIGMEGRERNTKGDEKGQKEFGRAQTVAAVVEKAQRRDCQMLEIRQLK